MQCTMCVRAAFGMQPPCSACRCWWDSSIAAHSHSTWAVGRHHGKGKLQEAAEGQQCLGAARGDDGQLRAFHNVCRHKAAPVAEGSGCVKMFECMYHGWEYGGRPSALACSRGSTPPFCRDLHLVTDSRASPATRQLLRASVA